MLKIHAHTEQFDGSVHAACGRTSRGLVAPTDLLFAAVPIDMRCKHCDRLEFMHGQPDWHHGDAMTTAMEFLRSPEAMLLRDARGWLWNGVGSCVHGQQIYICRALATAVTREVGVKERVSRVIIKRLGDCYSLRIWLARALGVMTTDMTVQAVQAHRLAWMNRLIIEFEVRHHNKAASKPT